MINRKILLMALFSFAAHLAIAAVIVYIPYDMIGNSLAGHRDRVIWGYVKGGEKSAKDDENPVRHPELVSGSQMMQGQEIPKQVRDDRTDRETEFSSENEISASALIIAENVLAEGQKVETGVTSLQSDGSDAGNMNIFNTSEDCESVTLSNGNQGSNSFDMHVLAEDVRKEIEKNKYYPDIAKLRGIEGTVYINFYIGQDGIPSSISVARSSGSGILDDAGIRTIGMVGKFSNLHKDLRELDIVVPITYKLGE